MHSPATMAKCPAHANRHENTCIYDVTLTEPQYIFITSFTILLTYYVTNILPSAQICTPV